MSRKRKLKTVKGDRYILCRFSLRYGPMVEDSDNSLEKLLGRVPDHLHDGDNEVLSVLRVDRWVVVVDDDPTDFIPKDYVTLYEIHHYADPEEEEEGDSLSIDGEDEDAA